MTARRPAPARSGSSWTRWLVTAAGLAAVTTVAFGGGLLAGVLFEEPGLVSSYVLGDATSVEWGAGAAEPPAVAAAPPGAASPSEAAPPSEAKPAKGSGSARARDRSPASPPPAAAVEAAPEPAPPRTPEARAVAAAGAPAAAAAPRPGRFAVQVGAFAGQGSAVHLADALRAKGHPVYVVRSGRGAQARWRVRVGPLASRPEAERAASRLRRDEKLPTWILREEAG